MSADRRYELCGGNLLAFRDHTSQEILLAGPAGTGKTFTNLARVLQFGDTYPNARMLILRKTRHSLTETALVTWERDVLGEGHPIIAKPINRGHRHSYVFPNKSVLVTGGMDNPDKVLSSEWDLIYVNEATELDEKDWETLGSRLRANSGPYDQLIGDCNPTSPKHWLYKRCMVKKCTLYPTHHFENPRYYDYRLRAWTEAGRRYVHGRLKQLTGSRRDRFLFGKWVAAEGVVYDYDPAVHDLPADWAPPADWRRVWAIDWGDRSPTVLQFWAVDPEGRMHGYREVFRCRLRADELGRWVKTTLLDTGVEGLPYAAVCDHDPDKKAEFEKATGVSLTMADKADRGRGIQATQARFDREVIGVTQTGEPLLGKPRIFFKDNARCHEPDGALVDEGRPASTVEELVGYVWDPRFVKDEPIGENDHGADAMRYAVMFVDANLSPNSIVGAYSEPPKSPRLPTHMGKVGSATGW